MQVKQNTKLFKQQFKKFINLQYQQISINHKQTLPDKLDAAIIGGGHNGLISSFYLSQKNLKTGIFENRHIVGGAAITEEIIPGFRFSRASYLYSLFRPSIVKDMNLINRPNGLKLYHRDPDSFTPLSNNKDYLLMGSDQLNFSEISKFSKKDAQNYVKYQQKLRSIVQILDPLFDQIPIDFQSENMTLLEKLQSILPIAQKLKGNTHLIPYLIEMLTAPTSKILNEWFESEPLKATLAYDSIIGAQISPDQNGSSYVLLHHFMNVNPDAPGWSYVQGGMGALTQLLAEVTQEAGTQIYTEQTVKQILLSESGKKAEGIELENGHKIKCNLVLSNANAHHTYNNLCPQESLKPEFLNKINAFDYKSPVFKINVALSKIPEFTCINKQYSNGETGPEHRGTIHLGADNLQDIVNSYQDSEQGIYSKRPLIELSLPTAHDKTLVDNKNHHTAGLFVQYAPYHLPWENQEYKEKFVKKVFSIVDEYAPGFSESIIGYDALSPKDIENIIGLRGGNIFQGSMSLDQLYFNRNEYKSPIQNLYLCGSSTHPGGGVTGAPGKNCAQQVLKDQKL